MILANSQNLIDNLVVILKYLEAVKCTDKFPHPIVDVMCNNRSTYKKKGGSLGNNFTGMKFGFPDLIRTHTTHATTSLIHLGFYCRAVMGNKSVL